MKCLEKDRARRYETANGLAFDLKRHLSNEPVLARPPSAGYKLQKAFRRNKLVFTAGTVMAITLVGGIAVSTWQAIVASRARNAEKEQRLAAQTQRDKAQAAQKEAERAQQAEKQERVRADEQRQRAEAGETSARRNLYVAYISLAQQAWEQNNVVRLRELLDETATDPARGFEWYYWQRQAHLELKTLRGHTDFVMSVAYSSDGQRIVTGSADHLAKVWEAASGKELLTLKGTGGTIFSAALSPDGQRVVTGSEDPAPKVWEAATARQVAGWQQEEKEATERLAVLRREQEAVAERGRALRAQDPGAIKQWLVLAPIAFEGGNGAAALQQEQIALEAALRPRAGERVKVGDGEQVWAVLRMEDDEIDFNALLGEVTSDSVACAVCYIVVPKTRFQTLILRKNP
jgi:hypothetical protein